MLSEKQIAEFKRPFEYKEHGFVDKKPYLLKSSISDRLNRMAPGWILLPPELVTVDGDVVVMRGGIQIGDVKRYAIGTGTILRADKNGVVFDGAKLTGMIAKAYKTAARDILPRAALEFGMGEYLKNKPKGITEDNFAGWLAKLTTLSADPNAWTRENILVWGDKWHAQNLTDAQLMKALGITDKWSDFKGTIAEADKAVEAFINISRLDAPAQPKSTTSSTTAQLRMIECPVHLLEPGDVVYQTYKTSGSGPAESRLEVIKNFGKVSNSSIRLVIKLLPDGTPQTVEWPSGNQILCDGPKVRMAADKPDLCLPGRNGGRPVWNGQLAVMSS